MSNRKYTEEEKKFVIENYELLGVVELTNRLKRTRASIRMLMKRLGIQYRDIRYFSVAQIEFIKNNYANTNTKEMSKILDRKVKDIGELARILGIKKDSWWSEEEINIVKNNYADNYYEIHKMLPNRTRKAIEKKAYEFGIVINEDTMFEIRNKNIKGNLTCTLTENSNFKNDKDLRRTCRNRLTNWKSGIVKRYKICALTDRTDNLIVHHMTSFSRIFDTVLDEYEQNGFIKNDDILECINLNGFKLVEEFIQEVASRHSLNDGILIHDSIHKKFHNIYGVRNFTKNDFYKFALDEYKIGLQDND